MAIETIRDLAFKISMNIQLDNLKKADKLVDDFKNKVIGMQRSVSKDIQKINGHLNNINTTKAIKRINDVTMATHKLREAMGSALPNTNNSPFNKPSNQPSRVKPIKEQGFKSKNTNKFNAWMTKANLFGNLGSALYFNTILQAQKILKSNNATASQYIRITQKQREATKGLVNALKNVRDIIGKNNYAMMGGIKGLTALGVKAMVVAGVLKTIRMGQQAYNKSLEVYADMNDGLVRQEAFYANALKYREKILGESLHTGANSYEEYRQVAQKSLMETRKNIDAVAQSGVVGAKSLTIMTGQLASFQIDTDAWFGGEQGARHINALADLMASIQSKTGSRDEALRTANMIGKAVTMGHFGQLQRWGIVLSDAQKNMIKTGTTAQRLGALMQGLEQNVGNFNKEMSKTAQGQLMMEQNKLGVKYYKLGQHMIYLKIQMTKLYSAWLPYLSKIIRLTGSIIGLISKVFTKMGEYHSWIITPLDEIQGKVSFLGAVFKTLVRFMKIPFLALYYILEDLWVYMNGGESLIGDTIEAFKDLGKWATSVLVTIKNKLMEWWNEFKIAVATWYKQIIETFIKIKDKVAQLAGEMKEAIWQGFKDVGERIKVFFEDKLNFIKNKIDEMKKYFSVDYWVDFAKNKLPSLPGGSDEKPLPNPNVSNPSNKTVAVTLGEGAIKIDLSGRNTDLTQDELKKAIYDSLNNAFNQAEIVVGAV